MMFHIMVKHVCSMARAYALRPPFLVIQIKTYYDYEIKTANTSWNGARNGRFLNGTSAGARLGTKLHRLNQALRPACVCGDDLQQRNVRRRYLLGIDDVERLHGQ